MRGIADSHEPKDLKMIAAELHDLYRKTSPHVRIVVSEIIKRHSVDLVDQLYRVMVAQPDANFYLDHETVNAELRQSLNDWLAEMFQRDFKDIEAFSRRQMQLGWSYARIKVPEQLISRGTRELKQRINANLRTTKLSREDLASAVQFVFIMVDLAVDIMMRAYISRTERDARSDEAFRLFSLNQNLATERERQRAALSEWAQTLFFELQLNPNSLSVPSLAQSEFGLWVFHRAGLLFDHSPEYARLLTIMADVDSYTEVLRSAEKRVECLKRTKKAIEEINSLLGLLFNGSLNAQGTRDPLTQLLNRKFVDTVLSAEIKAQRIRRRPFSILLIEIDQFDELRIRLGDDGADAITQRTAQMIFDAARSSDSVFSMGRETFLVVQVETELVAAKRFVDEIAERYASTHFTIDGKTVRDCSLNVGAIEYDGHPDPRQLVNRAQQALLEQKTSRKSRERRP